MKQFEKWLDENDIYNYFERKDLAEAVWKAVLGWVLEMFNTNTLNPPPTLNVREEIRAELKND